MLQRNSTLRRVGSLESLEKSTPKLGGTSQAPGWRVFLGDFLRYRARPERKHFKETPQVAQPPQGCPRGFGFRHSVTHPWLHQRLSVVFIVLSSLSYEDFHTLRLSPSYFLGAPTRVHLAALSGIATASFRVPFASECDTPLED